MTAKWDFKIGDRVERISQHRDSDLVIGTQGTVEQVGLDDAEIQILWDCRNYPEFYTKRFFENVQQLFERVENKVVDLWADDLQLEA